MRQSLWALKVMVNLVGQWDICSMFINAVMHAPDVWIKFPFNPAGYNIQHPDGMLVCLLYL